MAFSAAQRQSAAASLGSILGKNPQLDLGHVNPDSAQATRADNAGKVAQHCHLQREQQMAARRRSNISPM